MILFKEDWNRFPTAIPDFQTSNKSFLVYCEKLRMIGVENCLFPLALMNPSLQGVDPFDPTLPPDVRAAIFVECKENVWYYFREVMRIVPMASAKGIPFEAHRGNIAYIWGCMLHLSVALTLPRQFGKSVVADGVNQWVKDIAGRNSKIILVTKDEQLKTANIARLKKARKLLPPYISNISKKDADNMSEMTNTFLGNTFTVAIGQPSVDGANKAARGLTAPVFQFDEAPFTKNIRIMLTAALPAFIAASKEAEEYGNPYYVGYTTTAGKMDDPDGEFMYKIFHEGMLFNETLFDCKDRKHLVEVIKRNSTGDDELIYINFLHYQLGKTDEWLFKALAKTKSHGLEADRDYFNVWTNGTAEHPLSKNVLDAIIGSRTDAKYVELNERAYALNWYIGEDEIKERIVNDRKMIAGIDMSEGIGKDLITMIILAEEDLSVLATFSIKETNLMSFNDWVCDLMLKYPNLILIPENKSSGVGLIDSLLYKLPAMGVNPFKRIYNRIVDEADSGSEEYKMAMQPTSKIPMSVYERVKTKFGFRTSGSGYHARNKLYAEALHTAANFGGSKVRDTGLASEISSLSVRDGRIDHASGLHDDRVIGWLLATWMLAFSKNLSFYGITRALATARDISKTDNAAEMSDYDKYQLQKQDNIRMEIATLLDKIHGCDDIALVGHYRQRVITLESQLTSVDSLPKSINELIDDALKLRQMRIYNIQNKNR